MINTYALLDNGSQCTYIRDLTNQLELKDAKMKISISTVKSTHEQKELALTIFDINEDYELHIQKVFTMPKNMFNMLSQSHPATKEIYEEFLEGYCSTMFIRSKGPYWFKCSTCLSTTPAMQKNSCSVVCYKNILRVVIVLKANYYIKGKQRNTMLHRYNYCIKR